MLNSTFGGDLNMKPLSISRKSIEGRMPSNIRNHISVTRNQSNPKTPVSRNIKDS